jgi:hypothetical protein
MLRARCLGGLIPSETATSGSLGSFASRATSANPEIMGKFPVSGVLKTVGWAATFMAAAVAGMGIAASNG